MLYEVITRADQEWGLDHGTWSVLRHVFPDADVPIVQLGIDIGKPPAHHYELGRKLKALREKGVMVVGSGNIVHNLMKVRITSYNVCYTKLLRMEFFLSQLSLIVSSA